MVYVDIVLLTAHEGALWALTIKRSHAPFVDQFGLPGGAIDEDDADCQAAAERVLLKKTGIVSPYLEQLQTFSGPGRDPDGWSLSVAYFAAVPIDIVRAGKFEDFQLVKIEGGKIALKLPFDHNQIVAAAMSRLLSKSQYSSLPCFLAGRQFSLNTLQSVYETVLGEKQNVAGFRRKILGMDMLEAIPDTFEVGNQRPAQMYRLKKSARDALVNRPRGI